MNEKCNGLASVQCCNFDVKNCKYRSEEDDCYNPEIVKKALEKQLGRYTIPKRSPDSNGVLPLTSEELAEFGDICGLERCRKVQIRGCLIYAVEGDYYHKVNYYKAILWLDKLFELNNEVTK